MLNDVFGGHLNNLGKALDKTSERQAMLRKNLANVNVPGYKREDMDFSIVLDGEMDPNGSAPVKSNSSLRLDGNNVDMEAEVYAIGETELRYQTLTELTTRSFSGLKSAIREGK